MEKLIELLNELETPQSGIVFKSYDDYDGTFYGVDIDGETEIAWSDSLICSKKFLFIKWLVENEKINYGQLVGDNIWETAKDGGWTDYICLLMRLSVSDEPIKFLVSILK